ncbi:MAG: hypothetical protein LUE27_00565 [Clostridia bacterium]|nr:hypothetical protein [Clostridia bacterium]
MKPQAVKVIIEGEDGCEADGLLHENADEGIFRVSFRYNGDSVAIEQVPEGLHYARRGSQFVDVVYSEGKRTSCRIGTGPYAGEFEVITDKAGVLCRDDYAVVCVEYRSVGAQDERQTVKLRICKGRLR